MKQLKIAKVFLFIYAISITFLLLIGLISYLVYLSQYELSEKYENRYQSYLLADELRQSSDDLTRFARTYVIDGNPKYEKYYWDILAIRNGEKARPEFYERVYWDLVANDGQKPRPDGKTVALQNLMREAGFTDDEFEKLKQAQKNSDDLVYTETVAMNAVKGVILDSSGKFVPKGTPDFELARRIMHDDKYHSDKAKIMHPIDDFFKMLDARTLQSVEQKRKQNSWFLVALGLVLVASILINFLSFQVIQKRIIQPLLLLNQYSEKIAQGDFSQEIPVKSGNEVGKLAMAINQLANNLREKSDFVVEIGKGNLQMDYQPSSSKDLMGLALLEMRRNLQKIADEEVKRNWEAEGIAKFNELLRTHPDIQVLGDMLIAELVKYLSAVQGALFISGMQGDTRVLDLTAAYAHDRKKFINKQLLHNEGLVGQVFQEQKKMYINQLPDNYSDIVSGLGTISPKYLLIVPLKNFDKVEGVIELASFHPFEEHHLHFIEKISEAIASTLANIKSVRQTRALLETTQEQAEALKAQEEEMRQNLEELHTTQEAMNLKQKELEETNEKMKTNEAILTKMLEQIRLKEEESQQLIKEQQLQVEELQANELERRNNLEELRSTQKN